MSKVKIRLGALIMLIVMIISDRADILSLYFLSAALHEFGHLAAAKKLKIGIKEIVFDFSGVRICVEEGMESYKKEFLLSAAGPSVNFLVICIALTVFRINDISAEGVAEACMSFLFHEEYSHVGALGFVALSSFLQGGVNLLPVNSFDGGRMLYCTVAQLFSERAAERTVDIFSAFSAFVLWTVALYLMLKVSSGLAIYVFSATLFLSTFKSEMTL